MQDRGEFVKLAAREAGFDRCGIAAALPGEEDARLRAWLARGYNGEMDYMTRRMAPRELLPGCRSVISVAANYFVAGKAPPGPRISRYAWGEDYHRVIREMQADLMARLAAAFPGERFFHCCDKEPLLEKAWAQRAGIGWLGKNGLLVTQSHGSWVFLALLLTTADLPPDPPHPDRCGSCVRCLSSCPTDAFPAPRVVDARRCITYMTVEQKAPIDPAFDLAGWAFGCDACQEVCPWNRRARESHLAAFRPRPGQQVAPMEEWASMDDAEFRRRYFGTVLWRGGLSNLRRIARRWMPPS